MKGQGEAIDPELYENGRLARVPGHVTDIFTERALRVGDWTGHAPARTASPSGA